MITMRWWVLLSVVLFLVGTGLATGFLLEKTVQFTVGAGSPLPEQIQVNVGSPHVPPERTTARDPAMVAGASFMAKVTQLKQRLERNPKDQEALIFLGNANYDITRFEEASQYYRRLLDLDPANVHVRTDLATSLYNLGKKEEALAEIQKVLDYNPDHETALFNLGIVLLEIKNDKQGAIRAWEHLLSKHPDSPLVGSVREKLAQVKGRS